MSDFSSGILMRAAQQEIAKRHMEETTYLVRLNEAWLCRLSDNDSCAMAVQNYSEAVRSLSALVPLLHIQSAEDHGFALGILHNRQVAFHFKVDYGVENEFAFALGMELYGDDYMEVLFDDKVQANIQHEVQRRRGEIDGMINSFFTGVTEDGVARFELFGFDGESCSNIKRILTAENYRQDQMGHKMVADLLRALGLCEFRFVSHQYVRPDEGVFDIVASGKR